MPEACPALAVLQAFSAGNLAAAASSELQMHLGECFECARQLDEITRGHLTTLGGAPTLRPASPLPRVVGDLIRRAKGGFLEDKVDPAEVIRRLLTPSTRPDTLGCFAGYEVSAIAGSGSMGVVLQADDPTLRRSVAIKVLSPAHAWTEAASDRFLEEARTIAALQHDHVVIIHAAGREHQLPYLVMPFHPEGTLNDYLRAHGPLAAVDVARIGLQLARALAITHRKGILHRDIKPSNVLLEDGLNRVRLADFGLAQSVQRGPGASPMIAGTPEYMAPEQARGEAVDARSDLFGLGALLYHAATGQTVFGGETAEQVLSSAVRGQTRSLQAAGAKVPAALVRIIDRLIQPRPDARYGSASDLVRALEPMVEGPGRSRQIKRLSRATFVGLLLLAGTLASLELSGSTALVNTFLCRRSGDGYFIRGRFGTYAHLPAAVAAARPHDVIEARFSDERLLDSFRLGGKALTIRAAAGFTPVLVATNNAQPTVLVDAPLTLEGLTLWRRGPVINFPALISVEKTTLHLLNCRFLRSRFPSQDVLVWGRLRAVALNEPGPRPPYRTLVVFQHGSAGYVRNCLFAGTHAGAIGLRSSTEEPTHVELENCLLVTDRTLSMEAADVTKASLRLQRTVVVTGGFLELDETGLVSGVKVTLESCLLDRTQGALVRLNQAHGGELLRALDWTETNVVYSGRGSFAMNRRRRSLDSETEWNNFLRLTSTSHRLLDRQAFPETCVRSSLALRAVDLDPASLAAVDFGRERFTAHEIGEGKSYDTFRRGSAYRQWQRQAQAEALEWRKGPRQGWAR